MSKDRDALFKNKEDVGYKIKFKEWWFSQTGITRFGFYFILVGIVYLMTRAVSISLGWNKEWF